MRTVIIVEGCGVTKVLTDGPGDYPKDRNRVIIVNVDRIKDGFEEFPHFDHMGTIQSSKAQITNFLTDLESKIT